MHINDFNKICIIISTASTNYKEVENKIDKKLKSCYFNDYTIYLTENENYITEQSRKFALENPGSLIIAVGGDGSLSESVNGIVDLDAVFSFLPNGTGNDFSRTIYPNMDIDQIISKMDYLELVDVDLIKVNDEYSLNATCFGVESMVLEKSLEVKPKLGRFKKLSIVLGVLMILNKIKPFKYSYQYQLADGNTISGEVERIATSICNGKFFGTGFNPAPNASINDGMLDISAIKVKPIMTLLKFLSQYKKGSHEGHDAHEEYKVTSGHIKSLMGPMIGNIDGNIRYFDEIYFEVKNKALKLGKFIV